MTFLPVHNVRLSCYLFIVILANQTSRFFDQRYLRKEYASTIFILFGADRHINNKVKNKKFFDVRCGNFQGIQKMT